MNDHFVTVGASIIRFLSTGGNEYMPFRAVDGLGDVSYSAVMFGGYDKASLKLAASEVNTSIAFGGIGRDIRIYNRYGVQVWEGFINQVSIYRGASRLSIGPLMDVANRIKMKYTELSFNTNPPTGGDELETDWIVSSDWEIVDSIAQWGTLSEIYTCPRPLTETEAPGIAEGILRLKARMPSIVAIDSPGEDRIELECLGYFELTRKLISDYYQPTEELAADYVLTYPMLIGTPSFFNRSNVLSTLGQHTLRLYNEQMESSYEFIESAYSVLSTQTDYGFMFGVYNERSIHMHENARPEIPDLLMSLSTGKLSPVEVGAINPVRPGMWVKLIDGELSVPRIGDDMFLVSNVEYSSGNMAINAATFSAIDKMLDERGV